MRYRYFIVLAALLLSGPLGSRARLKAKLPPAPSARRIEWEVKNRFRLFRSEADFQRHVAADRDDGVLGAERRLETERRPRLGARHGRAAVRRSRPAG